MGDFKEPVKEELIGQKSKEPYKEKEKDEDKNAAYKKDCCMVIK
jgi:hypothetical protein